ncbi:MAG: MFS transporter [Henriciella sp.]|nr:MFS transporter [Henriciella sp.]
MAIRSAKLEVRQSYLLVTLLTYIMFFMFAMTTESIGEVIKLAKGEMGLTNIQASALHWSTMAAIAISGIGLGFLADRYGRKFTIILGLSMYGVASAVFYFGETFAMYLVLLFITGIAIGVFKTAALALIGDITSDAEEHTKQMNMVEGFFGIGAIVGPLCVVQFSERGIHWSWLYVLAAGMCLVMIIMALATEYPDMKKSESEVTLGRTFALLNNKYALGFSFACAMYVGCEVAIFVWLPTFLDGYSGTEIATVLATYAVTIFFVLRAAGRFLGVWLLNHFDWKLILLVYCLAIFLCFLFSGLLGQTASIFLLPLSGAFMSVVYPTLNSKGISCFDKSEHGAVAGLILFFTAASAAIFPLLMAFAADWIGGGDMRYGFYLATLLAAGLFGFSLYNLSQDPAGRVLAETR